VAASPVSALHEGDEGAGMRARLWHPRWAVTRCLRSSPSIDDQMGWVRWAARGTTRKNPTITQPGSRTIGLVPTRPKERLVFGPRPQP
jgi:hypothetical protein